MNLTLPDNFKQLSASQQAIYAAEALREASDSNPSGHKATLRKQVREYFGIANSTAERAEKLLKLYPELVAQVKAGTRSLPKSAQEWKALESQLAPPEDSSNSNCSKEGDTSVAPGTTSTSVPKPPLRPIEIPQRWQALATHPLAEPFPLLQGAEVDELVEDLRKDGLRQSIVVYEGAMLDGRNRNRGCEKAKVEPHFVEYTGDDPLGFVIAANLLRRHLTAGQRAEIAAKLLRTTATEAPPEGSSNSTSSEEETPASKTVRVNVLEKETPAPKTVKITQQEVADQMRISRTSVATAAAIKQASPETAAQVAAGKLSLNKAAKMAGVSKGYTKGSKADPVTEEGEKLLARCAEHLEAIHAEFPGFTVLEIAQGCITAAKHFIDGKYSPPEWATAAK